MKTGILSAVGNTPLVSLGRLFPDSKVDFFAKLEMLNPGGSTKDRTALLMLSKAIERGHIDINSTIIESSSGNMAIGLAQTCRYLNLELIVVTDPKINTSTLDILKAYGAQTEMVGQADANGSYLEARLNRVQALLKSVPNSYCPNQYENVLNPAAHAETMKEIVNDCGRAPDYLLAATSTCGTIMGCAKYARMMGFKTRMVAVDATGSVLFGPSGEKSMIPGYGAGKKSNHLDESFIQQVVHLTDEECIAGCRRLLHREAILAGGSSGAVVMAAKKLSLCIPEGSTCVLIFSDSGERYLDTIFNDDWVSKHFGKKPMVSSRSPIRRKQPVKAYVF